MRRSRLAIGVALVLTCAGAAQAQLSGQVRSRFVARFRGGCVSQAVNDERLSGVSSSVLVSICRCAGERVADTLDVSQLRAAVESGAGGRASTYPIDLGMEALEYCIGRQGGFVSGMTVKPNP